MNDSAKEWPAVLVRHLGESIATARKEKGMSAVKLSEATAAIGMSVHRVAIPRIEQGEQVVTVPELIALGIALEADWSLWLIDATDGADIGNSRGERMRLEAALQEVQREMAALDGRIKDASRALHPGNVEPLPAEIRRLREADLMGYQTLLQSLQTQEVALQELIRVNRRGHNPRSENDA